MQRYFCKEINNNSFTLSSDDTYHINKVMRMKVNDLIEIVYDKKTYICSIENLLPNTKAKVNEIKDEYNELPCKITICQSLVNEQKMDVIIQKCVELGVYSIIPYQATNSIVKENNKSDKKIIRWKRISKEAAEQSKRNIIPNIESIMDINEVIKQKYDCKLICSVNEMTTTMKKVIQNVENYGTMIIVIGPEGGFTEKEEKLFMENEFTRVSLGNRVLRTETASIVALSYINYELMR